MTRLWLVYFANILCENTPGKNEPPILGRGAESSRTGMQMVQNVVLFKGVNTSDVPGLWETNGTTTGTFELASERMLRALPATHSLNGEVLFEDVNPGALWVTNGTGSARLRFGDFGLAPTT